MIKTYTREEMISFLKTFLKGRTSCVGKVRVIEDKKSNKRVSFSMEILPDSIMELEFGEHGMRSDDYYFCFFKDTYEFKKVLCISTLIDTLKEVAEPQLLRSNAMEVAFPIVRESSHDEEETGHCRNCGKMFTREYWDQVVRCSCGEKN